MLESLVPEGAVAIVAAPADYEASLHPREAEAGRVGAMAKHRAAEYRAARSCARKALAQLGRPDFALVPGPDRAPVWPQGIVGSITHCPGYCAACAAPRGIVHGLGVDAEARSGFPVDLASDFSEPAERRQFAGAGYAAAEAASLIFSAKESVYKALYPLCGVFLEFEDVEIDLVSRTRFRISGRVLRLAGRYAEQVVGSLATNSSHVFTCATVAAL